MSQDLFNNHPEARDGEIFIGDLSRDNLFMMAPIKEWDFSLSEMRFGKEFIVPKTGIVMFPVFVPKRIYDERKKIWKESIDSQPRL